MSAACPSIVHRINCRPCTPVLNSCLAVQYRRPYTSGVLLEINAHSLFSKWFSESGKLIGRLFGKIQEVVEDEESLVFVLIDEVESLTAARCVGGVVLPAIGGRQRENGAVSPPQPWPPNCPAETPVAAPSPATPSGPSTPS